MANEPTKAVKEVKPKEIDWNERVPLLIPRDPTNPKEDDAVICVNGDITQIKRGVEVMVPRYVKQAYLDSVTQLTKAYDHQVKASETEGKDID